jgi:cell division protein FtsI (penicillin-binding protein 3)
MGYQVGVTPLQMAGAVSAVANGGTLFEPHLVRAIIRGGLRAPVATKPLRRAINEETAATLTTIMEGVVQRGTGRKAQLDDYRVAGKTGTAAKLVGGQYSHSDYNVSFVGFVPSRQPRLTIIVVVDSPRNGSPYGGTVAAPIFRRIAEASLRQLAVTPTINPPPVILAGNTTEVNARQIAGSAVRPAITPVGGPPVMPDVRGLGAREALRVLGASGLLVRLSGSGVVTSQTPAPGDAIEAGAWSALELRRGAQ